MIIIFQCYGGTHTSVVAASLYAGLISRTHPPEYSVLCSLPYFDRVNSKEVGALYRIGCDACGNPVFALGSRGHAAQMRLLMAAFLLLYGTPPAEVAVIDCMRYIPLVTRAGGFISRRLGMPALGRPLVCLGLRRVFPGLLRLVESFEKDPRSYLLPLLPAQS